MTSSLLTLAAAPIVAVAITAALRWVSSGSALRRQLDAETAILERLDSMQSALLQQLVREHIVQLATVTRFPRLARGDLAAVGLFLTEVAICALLAADIVIYGHSGPLMYLLLLTAFALSTHAWLAHLIGERAVERMHFARRHMKANALGEQVRSLSRFAWWVGHIPVVVLAAPFAALLSFPLETVVGLVVFLSMLVVFGAFWIFGDEWARQTRGRAGVTREEREKHTHKGFRFRLPRAPDDDEIAGHHRGGR